MNDPFIKRLCSDSQDGRTELAELETRYFYSHERREGMAFEEYKAMNTEHSVDVERQKAVEEGFMTPEEENDIENHISPNTDRTDVWLSKKFKAEASMIAGDPIEMQTFGPLLDKIATVNEESEVDKYVAGGHYNDVVPGMQYMEMMQYMLADKSGVEAHLFGQIYKYLMRAGKKDNYEQDVRKARWYINCLVKYIQTGSIDPHNNDN